MECRLRHTPFGPPNGKFVQARKKRQNALQLFTKAVDNFLGKILANFGRKWKTFLIFALSVKVR